MNADSLSLGLDAGSTLCKAVVCNGHGEIVASGQVPSPAGPHGPGPDQESLDAWWRAICDATQEAFASGLAARVRAVGLSCRHQPGILLDADGAAVSAGRTAVLHRTDPIVREVYGAPGWGREGPLAHGYAPLLISAAVWFRRRHPDLFGRVRRVGALHDYLIYRLCGAWATDFATGPGGPEWPPAARQFLGLSPSAFPSPRPMHAPAGSLTVTAADDLGLIPGLTVAVGAQDGACASFGAGAVEPGDGCITLSTNAVVRVVTGAVVRGTFGYPIAPSGAWAWVRGSAGAGRFLDTVAAMLDGGATPTDPARHAALAVEPIDAPPIRHSHFATPEDDPVRLKSRITELREAGWAPSAIYAGGMDVLVSEVVRLAAEAAAMQIEARRYVLTGGLTEVAGLRRRLEAGLDGPVAGVVREAAAIGAARLGVLAFQSAS